jgi:hypothetical protein
MKRIGYYFFASVLLLATGYCALWVLSSSHLAMMHCDNNFSLFHEEFRCRQPYIALIGIAITLPSSIFLFWKGSNQ